MRTLIQDADEEADPSPEYGEGHVFRSVNGRDGPFVSHGDANVLGIQKSGYFYSLEQTEEIGG